MRFNRILTDTLQLLSVHAMTPHEMIGDSGDLQGTPMGLTTRTVGMFTDKLHIFQPVKNCGFV
jgi:hypothetical protein